VKIAVVVQRYGAAINGGAELHARYVAEHLAKHVEVEVLTTCATDYITWRNTLTAGVDRVNGITVRRFPVIRERDPAEFGRLSDHVFLHPHSVNDELAWLDAEGPTSPELIAHITENVSAFDFFIFFSFRYYQTYHGVCAVHDKAILVPTAERDGALGLAMFGPIFRGMRGIMYNSLEERALIQAVSGNSAVPGVVVGVGSEVPAHSSAARFRQKFNLREHFAIYVGRIDENKGCAELFRYFERYARMLAESMHLVLIGTPVIPIPDHPKIHHLGFMTDEDKFDAIAAAELLIMPSYFESLSMVVLEAWAMGKAVLANGRCDVLKGQCIRSNGGLYYENFEEFVETLRAIDTNPSLAAALGRNGREYYRRHYTWPVIERKYLDMLEQLKRSSPDPTVAAMDPLPGWFARRRRNLPPADAVVARLPVGPAVDEDAVERRRHAGPPAAGPRTGMAAAARTRETRPPGPAAPRPAPPRPAGAAPAGEQRPARPADAAPPGEQRRQRTAGKRPAARTGERRPGQPGTDRNRPRRGGRARRRSGDR
jgi:glycosyltransferase involved in cell wall biosynthesis